MWSLLFGAASGLVVLVLACTNDISPFFVSGPPATANTRPQLQITNPTVSQPVSRGTRLLITWVDSDPGSQAEISFDLINTVTGAPYNLVDGIDENDETDSWSADTESIPEGTYSLRGTITDFVSLVETFATTDQTNSLVAITITGEGQAPANSPPQLDVFEPQFNQSVSQDDVLLVSIRPVDFEENVNDPDQGAPGDVPYDTDSETTVLIMLDVDENPSNDDPFNPDPEDLIILRQQTIPVGDFGARPFEIPIDVNTIPVRPDGSPYFVRATITDNTNPPLNVYADGTINVVTSASGSVDLGFVGKSVAGARITGFNPGANLGSNMASIGDFDDDGIDDFMIVAQFGNPRNRGLVGEAYLIYGQDNRRFGGDSNANSTSTSIPGVIFEGMPIRFNDPDLSLFGVANPRSDGITSVASVADQNGDGRPELLIGTPHTDGIFQGRDDDPGDDPPTGDETQDVELTLRQGQARTVVGDSDAVTTGYSGAQDAYINSGDQGVNFGSDTELEWLNAGDTNTSWVVMKFTDVLQSIPDSALTITDLEAILQVRVINTGGGASVHQLFTDFDESTVTFDNFAQGGGAPTAGVDYDAEELGTLSGDAAGEFTDVDITNVVQQLVDGQLDAIDNEIRLIIVPDADADNNTTFRSSEFGDPADQRPSLIVNYARALFGNSVGCYPDNLVNNISSGTPDTEDNAADAGGPCNVEAVGCALIIHSDNRDNRGLINPDRLDSTSVALELVGQQSLLPSDFEDALAQAGEPNRIAGARLQTGWFDCFDHLFTNQPPLNDRFGWTVASIGDMDNDQREEILISAPTNELDILDTTNAAYFPFSTHLASRRLTGSIIVLPGDNYDDPEPWRDKTEGIASNSIVPVNALPLNPKQSGCCSGCTSPRRFPPYVSPFTFEVFAEDVTDFLGGAQSAGDFNLDGVPDILCGGPGNDPVGLTDAGAVYILYGRTPTGDYDLRNGQADNPATRPPMLRIFGESNDDQFGGELIRGDVRESRKAGFIRQTSVRDIDGDRIDDVVIAAPRADFGDVETPDCSGDFNGDGAVDDLDLDMNLFDACLPDFAQEVFEDDSCKVFDFDNDRQLTEDQTRAYSEDGLILNDRNVLECLIAGDDNCCPIDNGFVAVVFGGVTTDGDRDISQIGTSDLPGVKFYGATPGDRAGMDVSSAGDFNKDGNGDLLIAAPGVLVQDINLRTRVGVVYLIFGGRHLYNREISLADVGTTDLPGVVFMSPYVDGRPNEAPPDHVGLLGDINNDGFDDIAVGITSADFVDETLPQDLNSPVTEPSAGRRPDAGDVFIVYGNNSGTNTLP